MKPIRATTAAVFGLHVAYGAVMLADLLATVAGRRGLPAGALKATLATGGGSALVSGILLALAD